MLQSADGNSYLKIFDRGAEIPAQGRRRLPDEEVTQAALLHFCLRVKDCRAMFTRAISAGASACVEPSTLQLGFPQVTVNHALVYSPNGEGIEFIEDTRFPAPGAASSAERFR